MKLKFNKKTEYFQEHINTIKFFSKSHRRERVMAGEKKDYNNTQHVKTMGTKTKPHQKQTAMLCEKPRCWTGQF